MENPLDSRIPVIAQAVEEWKQQNTEKSLADKTKKLLDTHSEQIVMKLLGFEEDKWKENAWELDHCNGRSGNSPAGDYLKQAQALTIKEWLANVKLPELSATKLKNLQAEFLNEYTYAYTRALRDLAQTKAKQDANVFFDQLVSQKAINKHMQAMALISPTK